MPDQYCILYYVRWLKEHCKGHSRQQDKPRRKPEMQHGRLHGICRNDSGQGQGWQVHGTCTYMYQVQSTCKYMVQDGQKIVLFVLFVLYKHRSRVAATVPYCQWQYSTRLYYCQYGAGITVMPYQLIPIHSESKYKKQFERTEHVDIRCLLSVLCTVESTLSTLTRRESITAILHLSLVLYLKKYM